MPRTAKGSADPLRLIQLLWSPETKVGRSGTTLAAVVDRAVALADVDGLEALTMRRIADEVGVGVMTLYGYVPGKPELLELMIDTVAASTYESYDKPATRNSWSDAVRHIARRNFEHGLAHSWLGDVPPSRPILGPGHLLKYEDELTPLDGIGLDDIGMDQTLTHVLAIAQYAARWEATMTQARRESELTDTQWWHLVGPRLADHLGTDAIPVSSRVGQSLANAGDPSGFLTRAVEGIIADMERRLAGTG